MSAVKLTKIGNSQGFTIPKEILEKGDFTLGDDLEVHLHSGRIILFKRPPHHSQMEFKGDTSLNDEDKTWLDADLGEWDSEE